MFKIINKKLKTTCSVLKNKGLTLVELMVVIGIFLLISGMVIFDYSSFRSNVSLQNLTDDIALSIRKAQGFAVGSRATSDSDFSNSYGVHFTINTNPPSVLDGSYKSFLMFYTPSTEKKYNVGTGNCGEILNNECIEYFRIKSADVIKNIEIEGVPITDPEGSIDIIFTRPDLRAYFCYRATLASACNTNISNISITISNDLVGEKERTKTISVQNTGQISIQ